MTRMDAQADVGDLCLQDLLGNHNEAHQLEGYIRSAEADSSALKKLLGHAARGQIDLTRLREWHDELAAELERRGHNHDSPMKYDLDVPIGVGMITDSATNQIHTRCDDCNERMEAAG